MKYILLRAGLANRLRTIVGFHFVFGKDVEFHWDLDDPSCNGKFADVFTAPSLSKIVDGRQTVEYFFEGQSTIPDILWKYGRQMISLNFTSVKELWGSKYIKSIEMHWYASFIPRLSIQKKVTDYLRQHNLLDNKFAAIHIRRTDHIILAQKNNVYMDLIEFDNFIATHKTKKIFLATDSTEMQERYAGQCLIFNRIIQSKGLRQTTLENALIDILISAHASEFKGTGFSSYSEAISIFHDVLRFA
jgi:hypothetical protein